MIPVARTPRHLPPTPELIALVRGGTPTREIARKYRTSKPAVYRAFYRSSLRLIAGQFVIDLELGFGSPGRRAHVARAALADADRILNSTDGAS